MGLDLKEDQGVRSPAEEVACACQSGPGVTDEGFTLGTFSSKRIKE